MISRVAPYFFTVQKWGSLLTVKSINISPLDFNMNQLYNTTALTPTVTIINSNLEEDFAAASAFYSLQYNLHYLPHSPKNSYAFLILIVL